MVDSSEFGVPARLDRVVISIEARRDLSDDALGVTVTGSSRKRTGVAWSLSEILSSAEDRDWLSEILSHVSVMPFDQRGLRQPRALDLATLRLERAQRGDRTLF